MPFDMNLIFLSLLAFGLIGMFISECIEPREKFMQKLRDQAEEDKKNDK